MDLHYHSTQISLKEPRGKKDSLVPCIVMGRGVVSFSVSVSKAIADKKAACSLFTQALMFTIKIRKGDLDAPVQTSALNPVCK